VNRKFLSIGLALSPILALSLSLALLQPATAQSGQVIHVPADQPTIQAAINAASAGDTVLVAAGIYTETINFGGRAITVASEAGPSVTIIDGNQLGSVATFASGEGRASVLSGFTLRNGRTSGDGGGIRTSVTSPTIVSNRIVDNRACNGGGGISVNSGSPLVQSNVISNNSQSGCSGGAGGGILITGAGSAQIFDNYISGNSWSSGGGISLFAAGTPVISNNIIIGNRVTGSTGSSGGGIDLANHSDALIQQNLIISNTASVRGGGVNWMVPSGRRGPLLVNNTIVGNSSPADSGIYADGFDAQTRLVNNIVVGNSAQPAIYCGNLNDTNPPLFSHNDVFNAAGGAAYGGLCSDQTGIAYNISADPWFIDADYHVHRHSPVINAGTDVDCPSRDKHGIPRPQGGSCDLGIYEIGQAFLPSIAVLLADD
jgi:hypothetical protein